MPPKRNGPKVKVQVMLNSEIASKVIKQAGLTGQGVSAYVRQILETHIKQEKNSPTA